LFYLSNKFVAFLFCNKAIAKLLTAKAYYSYLSLLSSKLYCSQFENTNLL